MAACGGGGGDDSAGPPPAPSTPDATASYVGSWTLSCMVTTPPNATYPDGISEDEVLKVTTLTSTRVATSVIRSIYNNGSCSTLTSYYRGFPVTSQADVVGTQVLAGSVVDRLQFRPDDGSPPFKAIAQLQGAQLFITRADAAGTVLDAEGYPAALDVSRGYTRAP